MKNIKLLCGTGLLSMMLMAPAYATEPSAHTDSEQEMPAVAVGAQTTATGVVTAIDLPSRVVTLRTEDGEQERMRVGEEARNLAQLEVGDRVVVTYQLGLAMALMPAGAGNQQQRGESATLDRTKLGQKPGGTLRRTIRVEATVRAIDTQARTVTLQGPQQTVTLKVAPDINLANIKVGDDVGAMYQESLAIKVIPAPSSGDK